MQRIVVLPLVPFLVLVVFSAWGAEGQQVHWVGEEIVPTKVGSGVTIRSIAVWSNGVQALVAAVSHSTGEQGPNRPAGLMIYSPPDEPRRIVVPVKDGSLVAQDLSDVVFRSDGQVLYGYHLGLNSVLAWNVKTGELVDRFAVGYGCPAIALNQGVTEFSSDQSLTDKVQPYLALRDEQGGLAVFDVNLRSMGTPLPMHVHPGGSMMDVAFSPLGDFIVSVGFGYPADAVNRKVAKTEWDSKKGDWRVTQEFRIPAPGYDVDVSPDGSRIAVATAGGIFCLPAARGGKLVRVPVGDALPGYSGRSDALEFIGPELLASGDGVNPDKGIPYAEAKVRIWNVATRQCVATLDHGAPVMDMAVDTRSGDLYVADVWGGLKRWRQAAVTAMKD